MSLAHLSRGARISAVKRGLIPPVRSERERQLRSRYGLTLEDYDALLASQGGVCAICQKPWRGNLYVDHDHETKEVRSLLCPRCNSLCGLIETSGNLIYAAINYLFRHHAMPSASVCGGRAA